MKTWLIIAVYIRTTSAVAKLKTEINSGLNWIRTHDLCGTGALLYQLSYQALRLFNPLTPVPLATARDEPWPFFLF